MNETEQFWAIVVPVIAFLIGLVFSLICSFIWTPRKIVVIGCVPFGIATLFAFFFLQSLIKSAAEGNQFGDMLRSGLATIFWLFPGIVLISPLPLLLGGFVGCSKRVGEKVREKGQKRKGLAPRSFAKEEGDDVGIKKGQA